MDANPLNVQLLGVPGVALLWLLTLAAFGVFGWRAWRLVGLLRRARPENRFDQPGRRLAGLVRHVLLQPRLLNERAIGVAHLLIFWGFVLYAACFNWTLARGLFPFLRVPFPDEVPLVALGLELFAVLVLAGLAAAAIRRLFFAPPHLHLSVDANLILLLIGLLMASTLFEQAFRIQAAGAGSAWSPLSSLLADLLPRLQASGAQAGARAMWWLHMIIVLGFLVYLPYSKHLHLLAAPFNVFFSSLRPPGDLTVAGAAEAHTAGAARWEEFTWKQLLTGFACAECGRCDRACPSLTAGYPLSPQQLIQQLKRRLLTVGSREHTPPAGNGNGNGEAPLIGSSITEAEIWACTTCMACLERCAVLNEQLPLVIQMRRHLVGEGKVDRGLQDMLGNLSRYGNSFGKSDRLRARWTQALGWKIKDARKELVEYLWFVGDYASYDPRLEESTRRMANIFKAAGVDFGILYEGERNAGNDVRRVGEEGLFEVLRDKNLQTLARARFTRIVTTDPHTYNTLKNEYGFNGHGPRVLHSTELLAELAQQGRLPLKQPVRSRLTYHDPCYLGRYNGIYEAPRQLLRSLGVELVEMPRNRNRSWCCGAGGGRIWMEDSPGIKERPAENRIREAAALPGVAGVVVACPKDVAMFRDALKTTATEGRLEVHEVADVVWEALNPPERSM
jgi:Fe-S oxidoreductase/nitrate reductase gamma subunit